MSTRYGHSNVGGGNQDQRERKDEGWESRQGGRQSRNAGSRGEPQPPEAGERNRETQPPPGTNTQGELAGIGEASRETERARLQKDESRPSGTDQPPRMGGPLGPDPTDPHLPEGAQSNEAKGTGAGGFDRGVDATNVGAVHQGVREEDAPDRS